MFVHGKTDFKCLGEKAFTYFSETYIMPTKWVHRAHPIHALYKNVSKCFPTAKTLPRGCKRCVYHRLKVSVDISMWVFVEISLSP